MKPNQWDALVSEARACDMLEVAQAHGASLRKQSGEFVGGCPVCGTGHDRFAIRPAKQLFVCRVCGVGGCGPIDLEMFLGNCDFVTAVKALTGTTSLSGKRLAATNAEAKQREDERKRQRIAEEANQRAKAAWLWAQRQPAAGSPVEHYLRQRRYTGVIPPTIGYLSARGEHPHAMVAAFALPNEVEPGELGPPLGVRAVHLTKLKPDGCDRIREGNGKMVVGRPLGLPVAVSCINDGLSLVITEGIEDALAYRATGFAAWAAGSAPMIPALAEHIPDYVTTLIIEQHTDEAAQRATTRLQTLLHERTVRPAERKPRPLFVTSDGQPDKFYPPERPIEIICREASE